MSVSFYVDGDDAHTESYECQCNWDDQGPNPDCSQCNGTGTVSFSVRNTEFNMSNSNFYFFWSNLGLMENHNDCCGSISPDDLERFWTKIQPITFGQGILDKIWSIFKGESII
jgi:hypothetical protein